jgi:hypothetical protein
MLGHFQTLLECVVTGPDQSFSTFPILTDGERDKLRKKWVNVQEQPFDAVDTLPSRGSLSERQANFSAAKRALLEKRLRGKPVDGSEA